MSYTSSMPTTFNWSPSRTGQRKNFSRCTRKHTNGLYYEGSNPNSTNLTMKCPTRWKHSSTHNTLTSSTHHWTFIAPTQRNGPYKLGRIISFPGSRGYPCPSPSPTGADSPPNATPPSTCYAHVTKTPSCQHTKPSKVHSPLTPHPWHHSGQRYLCT